MYAILKHFMENTTSSVGFINHKVNAQFQKIFPDWTKFLCSPEGLVFVCETSLGLPSHLLGSLFGSSSSPIGAPSDTFDNHVINVVCESTVSRVVPNVKENDTFLIKDQLYALNHMFDNHDLARVELLFRPLLVLSLITADTAGSVIETVPHIPFAH